MCPTQGALTMLVKPCSLSTDLSRFPQVIHSRNGRETYSKSSHPNPFTLQIKKLGSTQA